MPDREYQVMCVHSNNASFERGEIYTVQNGAIYSPVQNHYFNDWSQRGDDSIEALNKWFNLYGIYFSLVKSVVDDTELPDISEEEFFDALSL